MPNDEIAAAIRNLDKKFCIIMYGDSEKRGVMTRVWANEEEIKHLKRKESSRSQKEEDSIKEERKFRRHVIMVLIGGIFSLVTAIIVT